MSQIENVLSAQSVSWPYSIALNEIKSTTTASGRVSPCIRWQFLF
jgi:hypothetical protein